VLAPVLARLARIDGVAAARVEATGRFFCLEVAPGADLDRVAALGNEALAGRARRLTEEEAAEQLAARALGDPWLAAGEVQLLSLVEARVLSVRLSGEVSRKVGLAPRERELVAEALRAELTRAMSRVHAEGGRPDGGWIHDAWPAIAAAAAGRLPPELRAGVAETLPGLLAR